jgi:hypothetical protein
MTTHADEDGITWECDGCDELWVWGHPYEFSRGWKAAAREAWRSTHRDGVWLHWCPKCGRRDVPPKKAKNRRRVIIAPN